MDALIPKMVAQPAIILLTKKLVVTLVWVVPSVGIPVRGESRLPGSSGKNTKGVLLFMTSIFKLTACEFCGVFYDPGKASGSQCPVCELAINIAENVVPKRLEDQ